MQLSRLLFAGISLWAGLADFVRADDMSAVAPEFHASPQTIATCPWDITAVVALPDQQSICTGHGDGSLVVWSLGPSQPLRRMTGHSAAVTALDVDAAGRILSASEDGTLRVWNVDTGECQLELTGATSWLTCCAFSSDGRWAAGGGYDRILYLWRLDDPAATPLALEHGEASVLSVAVSADGRLLATGANDGRVRLWTMTEQGPSGSPSIIEATQGAARSLAFLRDSSRLVIGYETGIAELRSIEWGEAGAALGTEIELNTDATADQSAGASQGSLLGSVRSFDNSAGVTVLRALTDNPVIAAATVGGEICIWTFPEDPSGRAIRTVLSGHTGPVTGLARLSTTSGPAIVSVSVDRTIQLWRTKLLATPAIVTVPVPDSRLWALAVSEVNGQFAVGGRGGYLAIHDLESGTRIHQVAGFDETVDSLNFSSDGALLAVSSWKAPIVGIIDVATGTLKQTIDIAANGRQVHFTHDNLGVFVACDDNFTLQRVELAGATQSVVVSNLPTYAVDVSPDGGTLAVGSGNWQQAVPGALKLYNSADLTEIATLSGHEHAVRWVTFHPREPILASADENGVVIVWDLTTRSVLHRLINPDGCKPVAFSPNGDLLAVGLKDGSIQVWNWRTDELTQRMVTEDDVFDLAFSPDGTAIIAVDGEKQFSVFPVAEVNHSDTATNAAHWTATPENAE